MDRGTLLEKINRASLRFLIPLQPDELYKIIVSEAIKLVRGDLGSLFIFNKNKLIRMYASKNFLYKTKIRRRGYTYKAAKLNQPIIVKSEKIRKFHPIIDDLNIEAVVFIPLKYKKKSIGVLSIDLYNGKTLTKDELKIIKLFGSLASLAIRKTLLLNEMQNALEARDNFISSASHELRTPLTTIYGYVQLLQRKYKGSDAVELKWIKQLAAESIRMTNIINKLIEINRISAKRDQYIWKELNLITIINQTISYFDALYEDFEITFKNDIGDDVPIIADSERMQQALTHIIDNSIKFSLSSKKVKLELDSEDEDFIIRVIDAGTGIHQKDLPRVFESFYKGINSLEKGMGLGLYLAQHIIHNHKGAISVRSNLNKGTEVTITLPKISH